ncbi:UTRA domain-containing protein [Embleya sp. NBC_00888]|uniref:GntR family transcriptional regulator n=1 Tax=Embleya sp. NBC_00888 TaxID=2975960 RepID=UPI00386E621A|nr:UTRA domain-containing protein [Embleya sp. NBC_00888]
MEGDEWVHASMPYVKPREEGRRDAWTEEAAARGRKGGQRIIHAREVEPRSEIAALLGVAEGAPVIERRRMIYLDESPIELTNTYYPADIARGTRLAETAKIPGGAVTLLANLGHVGQWVREEVSARLPDPTEREALALGPYDPVLQLVRVTVNVQEEPFQVDVSVFPAETQRLRYEMRID